MKGEKKRGKEIQQMFSILRHAILLLIPDQELLITLKRR